VRLVRADVTPEQLASAPLRDRLPVPPEGEALRGVAAACPSADVDELVEGFLRRRRGDATELLTACGRGRAGSTAVRAALRRVHDGHWSGGERALARELRRLGAPPLQANVPVTRPSTGETAVLDLYAPSRRRAVEVDGWAYHVDRIRFASDRRRDRWLETECGIAVLRVAGADVHHSLGPTAQEVKAWLLA
jgi:very-short-patch-repair endonuclease